MPTESSGYPTNQPRKGASVATKPLTFDGDVIFNGSLTVNGTLTIKGKIACTQLRVTEGAIRLGDNDTPATQDLWLYVQRNCGSNGKQSALTLQPVGKANGALLLLVPGVDVPAGTIASEVMLYAQVVPGNTRRQRLTLAVVRQSDGPAYAVLDTTLSGAGDSQGMHEMPVQFNVGTHVAAVLDDKGFRVTEKPSPKTEGK